MASISEIEARIRAAVAARRAEGFRVISGSFGSVELKCLCPLSCFNPGGLDAAARSDLGVSTDWTVGFSAGFDGRRRDIGPSEAYALGAKLRAEWIP